MTAFGQYVVTLYSLHVSVVSILNGNTITGMLCFVVGIVAVACAEEIHFKEAAVSLSPYVSVIAANILCCIDD